MKESDIRAYWQSDEPIHKAWGDFICSKITENLRNKNIDLDSFLKIPVKLRTKDIDSLIDKALYRKKGYQNPYYDITDKVGARFVVLLTTDIRKIKDIIYLSTDWSYSEDRDYEKERQKNPLEFTYQSVHYVLKSIDNVEHNGIVIPMGTFCEVQVRTLLQHAHSELTHDSIYKSNRPAPPDIYRTAAKSMALIETTDEFFEQVTIDVNEFTKKERQIISILDNLYRERFPDIEPLKCKSSFLIIESFLDKVSDNFEHELRTFFDKNDFLLERISEKNYLHLYKQSVILLLFFMVKKYKSYTKKNCPLMEKDLRDIYTDLSISIDNI